jgi:hypothetical protein
MYSIHSVRLAIASLAVAIGFTACGKKVTPAPEAPPAAATTDSPTPPAEQSPQAPPSASAVPTGVAESVDYSKMSNEEKYFTEMADSITSFIQDHLRSKGRMPRDAKDVVALKIMSRVDVPDGYVLEINQKTGKATFKKKK